MIVYYNSHEVFLNSTRYERFGVSLIEVAACGILIGSTKVGEIPYTGEHEKDSYLCERNAEEIAASIDLLFLNKELQSKIAKSAMEKIKNTPGIQSDRSG